jgi:hypothetical protein
LNRLLGELKARGALDNTVVIVTSDHGEQFGEHGLFLHGNSLYQPLLHVPLVIRYPPAVPPGVRVASRATLRDLSATVLDLLKGPGTDARPGLSLSRYWSNGPDGTATGAAFGEVREAVARWVIRVPGRQATWPSSQRRHYHIRNGDGTAVVCDRD